MLPFSKGWGTPPNPKEALRWLKSAATGHSVEGQYSLGMLLLHGNEKGSVVNAVTARPEAGARWAP